MGAIASQITSLTIVYQIVYSDAGQRKHQSSASLALVRGIHRGPVNSTHKGPATRKMFPFDDVIMDITHDQTYDAKCMVQPQIRYPTNAQRNEHVIITSKRRFDVIVTRLLRFVFAGHTVHALLCFISDEYQSNLPISNKALYC